MSKLEFKLYGRKMQVVGWSKEKGKWKCIVANNEKEVIYFSRRQMEKLFENRMIPLDKLQKV